MRLVVKFEIWQWLHHRKTKMIALNSSSRKGFKTTASWEDDVLFLIGTIIGFQQGGLNPEHTSHLFTTLVILVRPTVAR